jgi:hypothetical protein
MNGRRVYHARGKVLGGSGSHQRDDLPARQPARLRALGRRPRHGDVEPRPLPAVLQADGDVPRRPDTPFRGHDGPLVLERGPATNPLFDAFFDATVQAGYPRTDDVNGYRQEGFAKFDRNVHRGRRLSAARAYLHPVKSRPNLTVVTRALAHRILFDGTRATGVEYSRSFAGRVRATERVDAGEVILCGGAFNSPQLLQLSGIGDADHLRSLGIEPSTTCPRSGAPAGPPRGLHPVREPPAGVDPAVDGDVEAADRRRDVAVPQGAGRHQPLRGRRVRALQRRGRLPEPDVPLPADRDPLRRHTVGRRRPRLPGAHRTDVLRRPRRRPDHLDRPAHQAGDPVQLPVDRSGPPRVGRGGPRDPNHPQPAGARGRSTAARSRRARRSRPTRRSSTGSRRMPRPPCTRRAPAGWAPRATAPMR